MTITLSRAQRRQMQKLADRVDLVTRSDRKFFERFGHRQHRVRVAAQCEIEQQNIMQGCSLSWPSGCQPYCVVKNIAEGVRLRLFMVGLKGADTDLNEETACAVYNDAATPKTLEIEAQLRKAAEARG